MSNHVRDSELFKNHVSRLKASLKAHSPDTICNFIESHTYLNGRPFSWDGHDYQKEIVNDPAQNIVVMKSAQIGISEMSARIAVARTVLINGFSVIYTLPSATSAASFMQTRINPIIDSSPYLKEMVSREIDNTSVKKFGNSFLWIKGCSVDRQAISVPSDMLIFDEIDNSSQEVMSLFESRIIHSPYKLTIKLSTPTIPNYGIHEAFMQSKRKFNFVKCNHCNEWFYPDYYKHVRVPGFSKGLEEIKKSNFADPGFHWRDAAVHCPHCEKALNLMETQRQWVVENPNDAFYDSGYRVSPFDNPKHIKPYELIKSSVEFVRPQDFQNQRLGTPMADSETTLQEEELDRSIISEYPGGGHTYVMGLDMGNTCWACICAVFPNGDLIVVRIEPIPLHSLVNRVAELVRQYKVRMTTVDRGPMVDSVYLIQQRIRNTFAAVFVQSKGIELFKVTDREGVAEKGVSDMRQVNIAKDSAMDVVMGMIRAGAIRKVSDSFDSTWKEHLMDNKRVRQFKNDELVLTWIKTQGNDHVHMALVYALIASRIIGVASGSNVSLPLLSTFKLKSKAAA